MLSVQLVPTEETPPMTGTAVVSSQVVIDFFLHNRFHRNEQGSRMTHSDVLPAEEISKPELDCNLQVISAVLFFGLAILMHFKCQG